MNVKNEILFNFIEIKVGKNEKNESVLALLKNAKKCGGEAAWEEKTNQSIEREMKKIIFSFKFKSTVLLATKNKVAFSSAQFKFKFKSRSRKKKKKKIK